MTLATRIILTILLWIGLPLVLFAYFKYSNSNLSIDKPSLLFILYTVFSWSIAMLAFVMESARQQLFQRPKSARSALRLGVYGCFAVVLAMLTSPWVDGASANAVFQIIILAFAYCYLAGLLYWLISVKSVKHVS